MKILLANFSKMVNDTGGTAKVNCAFANEMFKRGHEVAMVYSDDLEGDFFFPVFPEIKRWNIRYYGGKILNLPLSYRIRRELVRGFSKKMAASINEDFTAKYLTNNVAEILTEFVPDVIICFQPAAAKVYICDLKTRIPVILMAHGNPEDWFHWYPVEQIPAIRDSRIVQVLMPSFEQVIKNRFPHTETVVIGNVVPQFSCVNLSKNRNHHNIIFIGRLTRKHKRPHLLIDAFIPLAAKFPDWSVEIWGAESSRGYVKEMQQKIDRAGLTDRIKLMGVTQNVEEVLEQGDIFVFPSAAEGFGLTIAEAMSKGLPVIAYESCAAVNELVHNGTDGFLVADGTETLSAAIERLIINEKLRIKIGKKAHEAMKEFSAEKIWNKWLDVIQKVTVS